MKERKQSGVVPYIIENGVVKLIMIRKKSQDLWGFPKGGIEDNMSPVESAQKEALEEAGIVGRSTAFLGVTRYVKKRQPQTVKWYLMEVTKVHKHFDEEKKRKRKTFKVDKAITKVDPLWQNILHLALTRL